jgi:hypothetical protein
MRVFLTALCACGSASTTAPAPSTPATPVAPKQPVEAGVPLDVIASLAQPPTEVSWIAPGPAQLTLGGTSVQALEGAPRLEVNVLEQQGSDIRVGVRLEHVRFALWMSSSRLLSLIKKDHRLTIVGAHDYRADAMHVVLRGGAQVQRLAKKEDNTQVRYVGAVEVEGWVPTEVLVDRWPSPREGHGRRPTGRKQLMLTPGAVIRTEPKWNGSQLAILNQSYFVDEIRPVDENEPVGGPPRIGDVKKLEGMKKLDEQKRRNDNGWFEVSYEDGDVFVHGYVSKQAPPGRAHKKKPPEQTPPLTPNVNAHDGVCLRIGTEEIGFLVGDQAVFVEKTGRADAFKVTIDTPWGPITFDAKGATESELAKCGA